MWIPHWAYSTGDLKPFTEVAHIYMCLYVYGIIIPWKKKFCRCILQYELDDLSTLEYCTLYEYLYCLVGYSTAIVYVDYPTYKYHNIGGEKHL